MSKTRKDLFGSNVQPRKVIKPAREHWFCEECGRNNPAHLVQCNRCGAYGGG